MNSRDNDPNDISGNINKHNSLINGQSSLNRALQNTIHKLEPFNLQLLNKKDPNLEALGSLLAERSHIGGDIASAEIKLNDLQKQKSAGGYSKEELVDINTQIILAKAKLEELNSKEQTVAYRYNTIESNVDIDYAPGILQQYKKHISTYTKAENVRGRVTTESLKTSNLRAAQQSKFMGMSTEQLQKLAGEKELHLEQLGQELIYNVDDLVPGQKGFRESLNRVGVEGTSSIHAAEQELIDINSTIRMQQKQGISDVQLFSKKESALDYIKAIKRKDYFVKAAEQNKLGTLSEAYSEAETLEAKINKAEKDRDKFEEKKEYYTKASEDDKKAGNIKRSEYFENKANEFSTKMNDATNLIRDAVEDLGVVREKVSVLKEKGFDPDDGSFRNFMKRNEGAVLATSRVLGLASGAGNVYTSTYLQDLEEMQHKATFANYGNNIYRGANYFASSGNFEAGINSLIMTSSLKLAKGYGDKYETGAAVAHSLDTFSNILNEAAKGGENGGGWGATAGGINALLQSIPKTAAISKGLTRAAITEQAAQSIQGLIMASLGPAIDSAATYFGYYNNLGNAATGLGGIAGDTQSRLISKNFLKRADSVNLDDEKIIGMLSHLARGGSMSTDDIENYIISGGRASKMGIMSTTEYAGLSARMNLMGGKDQDLQDMIAKGMSMGLANSANINQMLNALESISSGVGSLGFSGAANKDLITDSAYRFIKAGGDRNLAIGAMTNSLNVLNQGAGDMSATLPNYAELAHLRQMFPNADTYQIGALANMDFTQIGVARQNPAFAKKLGLDKIMRSQGDWDILAEEKVFKSANNRMYDPRMVESIVSRIKSKTSLTEAQRSYLYLNNIDESTLPGLLGIQMTDTERKQQQTEAANFQVNTELNKITDESKKAAFMKRISAGESSIKILSDIQNAVSEEGASTRYKKGESNITDVVTQMKGISDAIVNLSDPKRAQEIVSQAAKDMQVPLFNTSVNTFHSTVQALKTHLEKMGIKVDDPDSTKEKRKLEPPSKDRSDMEDLEYMMKYMGGA